MAGLAGAVAAGATGGGGAVDEEGVVLGVPNDIEGSGGTPVDAGLGLLIEVD